ncbi:MAG: O-antigen ligase family protein [Methylocystis silviterrae]|uniref:O-antigen ligase family protein n=1 Tax=Methylocystis silviterrae TaxID=2743612 RepID=UPI003C78B716
MLFAAAWAADGATTVGAGQDQKKINSASIVVMLAGFCVFVALLAAQAMARSRGGLALTIVALLGALALAQRNLWGTKGVSFRGQLIAAIVLVFVFSTQFALYRIMERFEADPLADGRIAIARNTIEAAITIMPFGAGLGTFVPVYAMFDKPRDLMAGAYANRAHNDFLELWLETGVVGPILLGVFAFWLIRRSVEVWRRAQSGGLGIDQSLIRAATLIITLLLAHSLVDYPLRTGAMMAVFAVACALLIDRPPSSPARQPAPKEPSRSAAQRLPSAPRRKRLNFAMQDDLLSSLKRHYKMQGLFYRTLGLFKQTRRYKGDCGSRQSSPRCLVCAERLAGARSRDIGSHRNDGSLRRRSRCNRHSARLGESCSRPAFARLWNQGPSNPDQRPPPRGA